MEAVFSPKKKRNPKMNEKEKLEVIKNLTEVVIAFIHLLGSLFIVFLLTVVTGLGFFKVLAGFILFHYFLGKISGAFHPVFKRVSKAEAKEEMKKSVTEFVNWLESK